MYAIVEIAGQQFKITKDQYLYVHRLDAEVGAALSFESVMLIEDDGGQVSIGTPFVSGTSVSVTVLSHVRGDKVLIFKKKRRKGYRKSQGHRQDFTKIKIESILA